MPAMKSLPLQLLLLGVFVIALSVHGRRFGFIQHPSNVTAYLDQIAYMSCRPNGTYAFTWIINNRPAARYTPYVSFGNDYLLSINCTMELNSAQFQCASRIEGSVYYSDVATLHILGRDPVIDPKVNLSADPDHVLIHWLPPYPMDVPENTTWFNVKILTSSGLLVIDRNVTTNFIRIRKEHFEVGHKCNCTITTWNLAGKSEPITIVIPGPTPNTPMSTPMSSSSFIKDTNVDTSEISTWPIVIAAIILVFLLVVLVSLLVYIYTRVSLKSEKYDGRHLLAVVEKSPMGTLSPRQASDGVASIGSVMINFGGQMFSKPNQTSSSPTVIFPDEADDKETAGDLPKDQLSESQNPAFFSADDKETVNQSETVVKVFFEGAGNEYQGEASENSVFIKDESSSSPSDPKEEKKEETRHEGHNYTPTKETSMSSTLVPLINPFGKQENSEEKIPLLRKRK